MIFDGDNNCFKIVSLIEFNLFHTSTLIIIRALNNLRKGDKFEFRMENS